MLRSIFYFIKHVVCHNHFDGSDKIDFMVTYYDHP